MPEKGRIGPDKEWVDGFSKQESGVGWQFTKVAKWVQIHFDDSPTNRPENWADQNADQKCTHKHAPTWKTFPYSKVSSNHSIRKNDHFQKTAKNSGHAWDYLESKKSPKNQISENLPKKIFSIFLDNCRPLFRDPSFLYT